MYNCPICGTKFIVVKRYIVEESFKVVGGKVGKTRQSKTSPNHYNKLDEFLSCENCHAEYNLILDSNNKIIQNW